jgi:hypothetical protein
MTILHVCLIGVIYFYFFSFPLLESGNNQCKPIFNRYFGNFGAKMKVDQKNKMVAAKLSCFDGWVRESGVAEVVCKKQGDTKAWSAPILRCKPGKSTLFSGTDPGFESLLVVWRQTACLADTFWR